VKLVRVETARDMDAAVEAALPADLAIMAAAVADWRVVSEAQEKIKKDGSAPAPLHLVENPDILAKISRHPTARPKLVVGFAAETEQVIEHATVKLRRKGCDLIVANDVSPQSGVMGGDLNRVHLISGDGQESLPELPKIEVARALIARFSAQLEAKLRP
jgi:phosphopantothenoylcysteine decarboxylase/phosphopantothenate--cysteine ligase